MPICKGARLKIDRAEHHISDLEGRVDFLKNRLTVAAHVDANSGLEYIKCDFTSTEDRDAFDRLPVLIGDAVHNLKCALDYVWLETVQRLIPAGDWERTKFPIYPTPELLERELRKLQINVLTPNFFRFLLSEIKPYDGGDFAIRTVHIVDMGDKHRLLTPVIHYSSIGDIRVEQNGEIHKGFTSATTYPPPVYVGPFERGIHVKDPGSAAFAVMFQEGNDGSETRAVDTLRIYSRFIANTVKLFEDFIES
ncbi:MAG TPA: hypothetical protein VHT24_16720 [Pseudacidobacterium sp.]|jgi:hypothetical protein|nr:hypothetical protein [Pseudacidobacterium sp.]